MFQRRNRTFPVGEREGDEKEIYDTYNKSEQNTM